MGRTVRAAPAEIVQRLTCINKALVRASGKSHDSQASAYSLFQTAIGLEAQVRQRTAELKTGAGRPRAVPNVVRLSSARRWRKSQFVEDAFRGRRARPAAAAVRRPARSRRSPRCRRRRKARPCAARSIALVTIEAYLRSISTFRNSTPASSCRRKSRTSRWRKSSSPRS